MSAKIKLREGFYAIVDEADEYLVNSYKWTMDSCGYAVHVHRIHGKQKMMYMHRFIMRARPRQIVDHIDGDRLNNQRSNLRLVSTSQNSQNSFNKFKTSSIFKGVCWDAGLKKWRADIRLHGKRKFLGKFEDIVDAAIAYDQAALLYFGSDALTNEVYLKRLLEKLQMKKVTSKK